MQPWQINDVGGVGRPYLFHRSGDPIFSIGLRGLSAAIRREPYPLSSGRQDLSSASGQAAYQHPSGQLAPSAIGSGDPIYALASTGVSTGYCHQAVQPQQNLEGG